MDTENLKKMRSIYGELQGFLSQVPLPKETYESTGAELAGLIDNVIDRLNTITGEDFSRYKIHRENSGYEDFVRLVEYRTKLGGLISTIHATYFSNEAAPFSGGPSTVITQNQHQVTYVSMLLEVQDIINTKLQSATNENEKSFLQKVKEGLQTVKSTAELIGLIATTAQSFGIPISKLSELFR